MLMEIGAWFTMTPFPRYDMVTAKIEFFLKKFPSILIFWIEGQKTVLSRFTDSNLNFLGMGRKRNGSLFLSSYTAFLALLRLVVVILCSMSALPKDSFKVTSIFSFEISIRSTKFKTILRKPSKLFSVLI